MLPDCALQGSYSVNSTLGSQRSSRLTTEPAFGFGSSDRDHSASCAREPPPDKPNPPPLHPAPPFPRFPFLFSFQAKLFVSDLHSKSNGAAFGSSPGPSAYSLTPSIGTQATSRGKSAPSWGFGKANRFKANFADNGTPGPGAYAI